MEGAVDGLAALFAVLVSPGDAVAYADPYYPSYHCMTVMSRAEEILLPSLPERGFLPDLDAVPAQVWDRVKVLVLNYPNNPTGAQAPREFLQRAVDLAHEHHVAIVQDYYRCRVLSKLRWKCVRCRKCMRWPAGVPVSSRATTTSCLM